jgi:hypothetical protein
VKLSRGWACSRPSQALFFSRSMTLLPFLRPQPFLQRTLPTTIYRSIRMSSNIATLVADARKTLPSASKDSAAVDAWVEKISSGEEGKDLQVRLPSSPSTWRQATRKADSSLDLFDVGPRQEDRAGRLPLQQRALYRRRRYLRSSPPHPRPSLSLPLRLSSTRFKS